jgi:histidine triad (HIT) family protein
MTDTEPADCAFCAIIEGRATANIIQIWHDAIAIRPRRGGVNDSHVLVIPRTHVADAGTDPAVTAATMARAAELAAQRPASNIIANVGAAAGQTVMHLHLHVITRTKGDGIQLPWTAQQEAERAAWGVTSRG